MSHELHHFSMGLWVFFLSYAIAVIGSFVGLMCVHRASSAASANRRRLWVMAAAFAIGGVGIWLMHFIGMMGFDVPGSAVRYGIGLTVVSVILAVGATWFGLWIVVGVSATRRMPRGAAVAIGGVVMGLAVSGMHYSGMAAIRIKGSLGYDPKFVVLSVAIGLTASVAALLLAGFADRPVVRAASALVMGCAVTALHYTGMAGISAHVDLAQPNPSGLTVMEMLYPAFAIGAVVLGLPMAALLIDSMRSNTAQDEQLARWSVPQASGGSGTVVVGTSAQADARGDRRDVLASYPDPRRSSFDQESSFSVRAVDAERERVRFDRKNR